MRTAALYGQTLNLDESTKGLCLLFDHVHILLDKELASHTIDASPQTMGYLVNEGIVSFDDAPAVFSQYGVYQTQRDLLEWCLENIELELGDYEYSSYTRTPRSRAAFEGFFANDFVDQSLVDRLIDKKWALPVGAEIDPIYHGDMMSGAVLSPVDAAGPDGVQRESRSDVMVPSSTFPLPTEVPVLLHPSIWALHEALALLALPQAGRARGESWVPVRAGWGTQQRSHKWSFEIDELITKLRAESSVQQQIGQYFSGDFAALNLHLESVPMEEILEFRESHRNDFDEYLRSMASLLAAASADPLMGDGLKRQAGDLVQRAADIEAAAVRRWGVRSSIVTLSVGGFVWYVSHGQLADGMLMALPGLISTLSIDPPALPNGAQLFTDMKARFSSLR